jgi:hypothetical protein
MGNFMTLNNTYAKFINEQNEAEQAEQAESSKKKEEAIEKADVEMRLSDNLAIELTQTLNSFTALCAKVVKRKYATSDTLDRLENLFGKIKDLISAGKNSVNK